MEGRKGSSGAALNETEEERNEKNYSKTVYLAERCG
jgi:hypothetical protein